MSMNLAKLIAIFSLFTLSNCGGKGSKENDPRAISHAKCASQEFIANDSGGVFTGRILGLTGNSLNSLHRYLMLADRSGDTLDFKVRPDLIENFDEDKLQVGGCVTVSYKTEIIEEDGIELNRFYNATHFDYP